MFKYDFPSNYTPGVLLGLYNLDQPFISSIKSSLNTNYKNNINYLEITKDQLIKPKLKRIKDSNYDLLGMISLDWLEKFQYSIPGLIIQMFDITDLIIDPQNVDINQISEQVIKNIQLIKSVFQKSNLLILIKNFKKVNGLENNIKNIISKHFKSNFKEKNIFFINDTLYQNNAGFIKQLTKSIIEEIINFYNSKINVYIEKYNMQKNNEQKEYAIKYLIKIFLMAKITNMLIDDKKYNYYEFLNNAYETLIKLDKKSYLFCNDNLKVKYLEIKNLADFLLTQILFDKKLNQKNTFNLIIKHLYIFDSKNFFNDDKNDIKNNTNLLNEYNKYKDICFINMKWKYSWLKYLSEIITNLDNSDNLDNNNSKSLNHFNIINLYHIYIFLKKNPNFTQEIYSNINKEIVTKKIKTKYIEKIPKLYEMEGENIIGILSDEENLGLYISDLILENKNLTDAGFIIKLIKEYFNNNELSYYDFYLINKHCKDNEFYEDFNNVLIKIINNKGNNLYKFKNVYSHISNKINKIILELKLEKGEKNSINLIFEMIEYFLYYASISNKELSDEQITKINEILSYDINLENNNQIIHLDSLENKLFNLQIDYDAREVSLLDVININIDLSLQRKNLLMNINKIFIYFPKDRNAKEGNKNYKEIMINKELSQNNPLKFSFKYLINSYFNRLYITNIEIYLKNKIIINLFNKEKKDIIYCNQNENKINIDDVINIESINKTIILGKNENHLMNIKYNIKDDNKDIFIKKVKINVQLKEAKNYEFKIFENSAGYHLTEDKQIYYEYDNKNLEKNLPGIEYILKIYEIGNFVLNYKFKFTLINSNSLDDFCTLEYDKNIQVQSIESFIFTNEIKSSLYFVDPKTKLKSFPVNYPINIISYLENKLSEKIIINKIEHIYNNNSLEINCPTEELFNKLKNFNINFSPSETIFINAKILSKINNSGPFGKLQIFWTSENLYKNQIYTQSYMNNSIFDLSDININKLSLIIEGKYIKMCNKYEIGIKNLEMISKIIQFNIKEENKDEKYILCGKTNLKGVLTPNKEIKILYNIYDAITGGNIDEYRENNVYKFNNSFIINEYYISDIKDKFKPDNLKNVIYFSPELFKFSN